MLHVAHHVYMSITFFFFLGSISVLETMLPIVVSYYLQGATHCAVACHPKVYNTNLQCVPSNSKAQKRLLQVDTGQGPCVKVRLMPVQEVPKCPLWSSCNSCWMNAILRYCYLANAYSHLVKDLSVSVLA